MRPSAVALRRRVGWGRASFLLVVALMAAGATGGRLLHALALPPAAAPPTAEEAAACYRWKRIGSDSNGTDSGTARHAEGVARHHASHAACRGADGSLAVLSCDGVAGTIAPHCYRDDDGGGDGRKTVGQGGGHKERRACLAARGAGSTVSAPRAWDMRPVPNCSPFLLINNYKTGSSTLHWILHRHAARLGLEPKVDAIVAQHPTPVVGHVADQLRRHRPAVDLDGFLWLATMRRPEARVHSHYWQCKFAGSAANPDLCQLAGDVGAFVGVSKQPHLQQLLMRGQRGDTAQEAVNQLDLVLLTEHMEACLVLLHIKLGVRIEDLLHVPSKVRPHPTWNLTAAQREKLHTRTREEDAWYDYALARFEATVTALDGNGGAAAAAAAGSGRDGGRLGAAVEKFRALNAAAATACASEFVSPELGDEGVWGPRGTVDLRHRVAACRRTVCEQDDACRRNSFDPALYVPGAACPRPAAAASALGCNGTVSGAGAAAAGAGVADATSERAPQHNVHSVLEKWSTASQHDVHNHRHHHGHRHGTGGVVGGGSGGVGTHAGGGSGAGRGAGRGTGRGAGRGAGREGGGSGSGGGGENAGSGSSGAAPGTNAAGIDSLAKRAGGGRSSESVVGEGSSHPRGDSGTGSGGGGDTGGDSGERSSTSGGDDAAGGGGTTGSRGAGSSVVIDGGEGRSGVGDGDGPRKSGAARASRQDRLAALKARAHQLRGKVERNHRHNHHDGA